MLLPKWRMHSIHKVTDTYFHFIKKKMKLFDLKALFAHGQAHSPHPRIPLLTDHDTKMISTWISSDKITWKNTFITNVMERFWFWDIDIEDCNTYIHVWGGSFSVLEILRDTQTAAENWANLLMQRTPIFTEKFMTNRAFSKAFYKVSYLQRAFSSFLLLKGEW